MLVHVISFNGGNTAFLINAIHTLGHETFLITDKSHFKDAKVVIYPGVGSFKTCLDSISHLKKTLIDFIAKGGFYFGICVGFQCLFESSEEGFDSAGLGVFKGTCKKFDVSVVGAVPHIGWLSVNTQDFYFIHSFAFLDAIEPNIILPDRVNFIQSVYNGQKYVAALQYGNIVATQFHPEKSGNQGLNLLQSFLNFTQTRSPIELFSQRPHVSFHQNKRIIACLDVQQDENDEVVVTKGHGYNVYDSGKIRNLGSPQHLAKQYYDQGSDEIIFLNITAHKYASVPPQLLEMVRKTSRNVFVPLCIGGGIKNTSEQSALQAATLYFEAGADKVSIGSDAVYAALEYYNSGPTGSSAIEQISSTYGCQAVVVSIDPIRTLLSSISDTNVPLEDIVELSGEKYVYFCTTSGGKKTTLLTVRRLIAACEALGAGEFLCNSISHDGKNSGFDIPLMKHVKKFATVPVIASSGAGKTRDFVDLFTAVNIEAACAAGIFHRGECTVGDVKKECRENNVHVSGVFQ